MKRHIVLLGLPGAGKSTVGRLVAAELDAAFADVDENIERQSGGPIGRIFASQGEEEFRKLERDEMRRLLGQAPAVLAPGGGWAAWEDNLAGARGKALFIYLRTSPAAAAARTASETARPLLTGPDRLRDIEELLAAREGHYARADATVDTSDHSPEEVAREVARLARARAGW